MSPEGPELLAAACVPQLHRPIVTGRGQTLPVRTERHGIDPVGMPLKGAQLPAADRVPHLDGLIVTSRGQELSIRAEGHAKDPIGVAFEGEEVALAESALVVPLPAA